MNEENLKKDREAGRTPYEDGLYKAWLPCKVLSKRTKDRLWRGPRYFFVIEVLNQVVEIEVSLRNYFKDDSMSNIKMFSKDARTWFTNRESAEE